MTPIIITLCLASINLFLLVSIFINVAKLYINEPIKI